MNVVPPVCCLTSFARSLRISMNSHLVFATCMFKDGMGCEATSCSIPKMRQLEGFTEEGCWVLPSTLCNGQIAGVPYPQQDAMGTDVSSPLFAVGPCSNA